MASLAETDKNLLGLLLDPVFESHDTGPGHPERPERLSALRKGLSEKDLVSRCKRIEPAEAAIKDLLSVHSKNYLDRLEFACKSGMSYIDTTDSAICPDSFYIAKLAAGGTIEATDLVASGKLNSAFCALRPPGHHAERDYSMGFCLLNNVALAAMRLKTLHGIGRIAIIDWDVHHGNGTQHAFDQDPGVLYISLHQSPETLFPGTGFAHETGKGAGLGTTLNIPLPPGTGDEEYLEAFDRQAVPLLEKFAPEFLLVSAGYDAHADDPLASLSLSLNAFSELNQRVIRLAGEYCEGRIIAVLEGGYIPEVLIESVSVFLMMLLGEEPINQEK